MKLYVLQKPDADTLAECREVDDKAPPPDAPFVEMTVKAFEAWKAAQITEGWTPATREPAPVRMQHTRVILDRLTPEEAQALFAAEAESWQVRLLVLKAASAGAVRDDDPDFAAAVILLDNMKAIAAARWDELLAP